MKKWPLLIVMMLTGSLLFTACNNESENIETSGEMKDSTESDMVSEAKIKEEAVTYTSGGNTYNGYVAFDSTSNEKRPIVLVVHEWWGLTEYPRMRARMLAQLGYLAMAVDMYGNGKIANSPEEAMKAATPFYQNPKNATAILTAALDKAKSLPQADTSKTAAIGYCFGGSMVLNAAKLGADLDGVVSFHGGLEGVQPNKEVLQSKVLVLHGEADNFVPQAQVDAFRKSMDSVNADYEIKTYPNATHAFTNKGSDETGQKFNMPIKYNGAADTASWNDMKSFFNKLF